MTTPVPSAATCLSRRSLFIALPAVLLLAPLPLEAQAPRTDTPITTAGCLVVEADFVRATGMRSAAPGTDLRNEVILIDSAGTAFSVNGTRERDLLTRVGSRVEVNGTVEGWSSDVTLERLPEDVPLGAQAHEPGDSATARDEQVVLTPPTLQRINVRSFHAVDGTCTPIVADAKPDAADVSPSDRAARRAIVDASPTPERVRAQGCIVRDPGGSDRLVLSQATVRRPDVVLTSAVPGSVPSGTGSGTTAAPRAVATAGGTMAFYLNGQEKSVAALLGSRAEVLGTVAAESAAPGKPDTDAASTTRATTAHPSAPVRAIAIESIRAIGGACAP